MNMIQEEKKITESILKGFENNEFKMYPQFILDNKTKKMFRQRHFPDGIAIQKVLSVPENTLKIWKWQV